MTDNAVRIAKRDKDRKRQRYIRWMSSFAVTAGVALTAAFSPSPADAVFLRLSAFGDTILYETQVKDPETTLAEEDLWIWAEGPDGTQKEPLSVGTDAGGFTGLSPGTEYAVSIRGKGDWGEAVLAEETVVTVPDPGGGILSWELLPGSGQPYESPPYLVRTRIWDPDGVYSGFSLSYATATWEDPDTLLTDWTAASPGTEEGTFVLEWLAPMNLNVFLKLTAEGPSGTAVLDEITFPTPVRISASLYLSQTTASSLSFTFWADSSSALPVVYSFSLTNGTVPLDSRILEPLPDDGFESQEVAFTVSGLSAETPYRATLEAAYDDPDTGRPAVQILTEEDYLTTPPWSLSYSAVPEGSGWRYDLDAWDPDGVLGSGFRFSIRYRDETMEQDAWFASGDVFWTEGEDGHRAGTFFSETPPAPAWTLTVTVTMRPAEGIEYSWITLLEAEIRGNG